MVFARRLAMASGRDLWWAVLRPEVEVPVIKQRLAFRRLNPDTVWALAKFIRSSSGHGVISLSPSFNYSKSYIVRRRKKRICHALPSSRYAFASFLCNPWQHFIPTPVTYTEKNHGFCYDLSCLFMAPSPVFLSHAPPLFPSEDCCS